MAIDKHSPTWRAINLHIIERQTAIIKELVTHGLSVERTEFLRGQIIELDTLGSLAAEKPLPKPDHERFDGYGTD